MRIAYIGDGWGTSMHRFRALGRLRHEVCLIDPRKLLPESSLLDKWWWHTGGIGISSFIDNEIFRRVSAFHPDIVWVNQGEFIGPDLLRRLKACGLLTINYANDDPFRPDRFQSRFRLYRKAIREYDLAIVLREPNVAEAKARGACRVVRVWMSADEEAHRLVEVTAAQREKYANEVCFVGTWMPERGPFMAELIRCGVPLAIWGDAWHKADEWPVLKAHWRGPGIYGDDYRLPILCSKICIGMLSKGNRDLHTSRSIEIPVLGGLLCAERTSEHLHLYAEGEEAVFWDSAEECAQLCQRLLRDDALRTRIAAAGNARAIRNGNFNEPKLARILEQAIQLDGPAQPTKIVNP